jgi:hypothetical protein
MKTYQLTYGISPYFCVQDLDDSQRLQLQRHVHAQDYFGTLATVLSLCAQEKELDTQIAEEVVDELIFLQEHFLIKENNTSS